MPPNERERKLDLVLNNSTILFLVFIEGHETHLSVFMVLILVLLCYKSEEKCKNLYKTVHCVLFISVGLSITSFAVFHLFLFPGFFLPFLSFGISESNTLLFMAIVSLFYLKKRLRLSQRLEFKCSCSLHGCCSDYWFTKGNIVFTIFSTHRK